MLPAESDWTNGCYNPAARIFKSTVDPDGYVLLAAKSALKLQNTFGSVGDWDAVQKKLQDMNIDLTTLGVDINDPKAVLEALVAVLEGDDFTKLGKLVGMNEK